MLGAGNSDVRDSNTSCTAMWFWLVLQWEARMKKTYGILRVSWRDGKNVSEVKLYVCKCNLLKKGRAVEVKANTRGCTGDLQLLQCVIYTHLLMDNLYHLFCQPWLWLLALNCVHVFTRPLEAQLYQSHFKTEVLVPVTTLVKLPLLETHQTTMKEPKNWILHALSLLRQDHFGTVPGFWCSKWCSS